MPWKKDKTKAETRAEARASKRDELHALHLALLRDSLRLTDDELLETWQVIASVAAGKVLERIMADDMTGTAALTCIAERARGEIESILDRRRRDLLWGEDGGGDKMTIVFEHTPPPSPDDDEDGDAPAECESD
jgi:hypothetical protein